MKPTVYADLHIVEARAILPSATSRRQETVRAQIDVARRSLADARKPETDTRRMLQAAKRQLIQALVLTGNYDTAANVVAAIGHVDAALAATE